MINVMLLKREIDCENFFVHMNKNTKRQLIIDKSHILKFQLSTGQFHICRFRDSNNRNYEHNYS